MAVTRAEIANRALRKLGVLPFGQSADSNRTDAALQAYDEVYAYLEELGIVDWGSTASVPNEYVFWVVAIVAYNLCDDIATPDNRYMRIKSDYAQAEAAIRRVYNNAYTRDETKVVDY